MKDVCLTFVWEGGYCWFIVDWCLLPGSDRLSATFHTCCVIKCSCKIQAKSIFLCQFWGHYLKIKIIGASFNVLTWLCICCHIVLEEQNGNTEPTSLKISQYIRWCAFELSSSYSSFTHTHKDRGTYLHSQMHTFPCYHTQSWRTTRTPAHTQNLTQIFTLIMGIWSPLSQFIFRRPKLKSGCE